MAVIEKIVNLVVKSNADKATEDVKELNEEIKQTETATKDTTKATEDLGRTTDNITGGMVGKFKGLLTSVRGVISSFGLLKTAIIATGLGALLVAIVSIKQAFTSSEEGQNRFIKLMQRIGVVVGNVTDILSDLGSSLVSLGSVLANIVTGDIEGAKKAFNEFKKEIYATAQGIRNFGEETSKELKKADEIANKKAKADKAERELIVARAKADRERAELLEKAQQRQNFTVQQRIQFLKDASALEEQITNKEIEAAKLRRDAIVLENTLSKSNKEALQAEEEAKAKVIQLETARLSKQKEVTGQISGLIEQEKAIRKAAYDAEVAANDEKNAKKLEADRKHLEELQKLAEQEENDFKRILEAEDEFLQSDIEKELQANYDKYAELIALAEQYGQNTSVLLEAQLSYENEIKEKYAQKELEDNKAKNDKLKEQDKQLQEQKIDAVTNGFSTISNLAQAFAGQSEEQQKRAFEVQKVANTANALIDTYKSATSAYASLVAVPVVGPALGAAAAGAAIAAGLANVKAIQSQKFATSGASVGSAAVPNVTNSQATQQLSTPNFNVVGASGISQTENLQPVKAYVVSGDVTTAQALDRNRIQNATF